MDLNMSWERRTRLGKNMSWKRRTEVRKKEHGLGKKNMGGKEAQRLGKKKMGCDRRTWVG